MIINHKCEKYVAMHSITVINRVICSFLDYVLIQSLSLTFLIKEWFTLFLFSVLSWFFPFFLVIGVFEFTQDSNQKTSLLYTCCFFSPSPTRPKLMSADPSDWLSFNMAMQLYMSSWSTRFYLVSEWIW